jgi:hypothetical protein
MEVVWPRQALPGRSRLRRPSADAAVCISTPGVILPLNTQRARPAALVYLSAII